MAYVLVLLYLFLVPLLIMKASKKWPIVNKLTPMSILYVIGLAFGNLGLIPPKASACVAAVSDLAVPLSLPLLLFACNFRNFPTLKAFSAFFSGLLSVTLITFVGFYIFGGTFSDDQFAQICAVALGIYTGGIPNIAAISKGVGLSDELYLLITSYDLIATGLYLIFVISIGKWFFRKTLGADPSLNDLSIDEDVPKIKNPMVVVKLVGLAIVVAALSCGITYLIMGAINVAIMILVLTTLSILVAQNKIIQQDAWQGFDFGLYIVNVFCLSIATQVNVSELHLLGSLNVLGLVMFVIFGSVLLQVIFGRLLKLDGDTVMVSSVALINSPPFVPMVAGVLGNKNVVITGIAVGLLGYALGNYLGIGLWWLLR